MRDFFQTIGRVLIKRDPKLFSDSSLDSTSSFISIPMSFIIIDLDVFFIHHEKLRTYLHLFLTPLNFKSRFFPPPLPRSSPHFRPSSLFSPNKLYSPAFAPMITELALATLHVQKQMIADKGKEISEIQFRRQPSTNLKLLTRETLTTKPRNLQCSYAPTVRDEARLPFSSPDMLRDEALST